MDCRLSDGFPLPATLSLWSRDPLRITARSGRTQICAFAPLGFYNKFDFIRRRAPF